MSRRGVYLSVAVLATTLLTGAAAPGDKELLDATKRGDVAAVRSLLGEGADPNVSQGDGMSALHLAAQEGNLDIVNVLLEAGATVGAKTRIGDYTPLHLASWGAHTSSVSALIEAGANPGIVTTTSGVTPLHLAAKATNGESTVRALLERGAPVDARESTYGQTPLIFAASYGRTAAILELLSHGADPAISTEVVDVLARTAIDKEAQVRLQEATTKIRRNSAGGTDRALTLAEVQTAIAAQREFLRSDEAIDQLLKGFDPDDLAVRRPSWTTPSGYSSEVQVDAPPMWDTWVGKTGGMTAVLHAAREGYLGAVEALLDGGADIDQVSGNGTSPLLLATLNGQFDLALVLIERGANPNLATNTDGVSALFAVLQTQWAGNFTAQPRPNEHETQQSEYMDVLVALLAAGADPNVPLKTHLWYWEYTTGSRLGLDITGATPFWRAAFAQDIDAMKALAAHGADPNAPTKWPAPGMRGGRQQDGRLQEDSGLPLMPEGTPNMYPLHAAAGGGWLGVGAYMINSVPDNFVNAVSYLVDEHGADVNLRDSWGYSPLHYAAVRGGSDLIEYLVSKGADAKAISRLGQSTADMARGGNGGYFERPPYPEAADLLRSLGSEFKCFNTHFRGTGDFCAGAGAKPFEHMVEAAEEPVR
jgi:ankyrin repeat protein